MIEVINNEQSKFDHRYYALYDYANLGKDALAGAEFVYYVPKYISGISDIIIITDDGERYPTHNVILSKDIVMHILLNDPTPIVSQTKSVTEAFSSIGTLSTAIDPTKYYLKRIINGCIDDVPIIITEERLKFRGIEYHERIESPEIR